MKTYTEEELFYAEQAFTAYGRTGWASLSSDVQVVWVYVAEAARAAVYVDPIEALAKELCVSAGDGDSLKHSLASKAYYAQAKRMYELGARAPAGEKK